MFTFWKKFKSLFTETKDVLQEIWRHDTSDRQTFFNDQEKNMTGKKSNSWSTVTYRVALAIHSRRILSCE